MVGFSTFKSDLSDLTPSSEIETKPWVTRDIQPDDEVLYDQTFPDRPPFSTYIFFFLPKNITHGI